MSNKFTKEEKKFWMREFRIENPSQIQNPFPGIHSVDSNLDDEFLSFLLLRIDHIGDIHLNNTEVTDEGVKLIGQFKSIQSLSLIDSREITANCLQYISTMDTLEVLQLMKSPISIDDLLKLNSMKNLKEIHFNTADESETTLEKVIQLEGQLAGCKIYLNYAQSSKY